MQILCISYLFKYCSWQWMAFIADVTPLGARRATGKEKENFSGFQWIQSGMFIKLWNICDHLFICDIYDLCSYAIQTTFGAKQELINFHILTVVWLLNVVSCITIRVAVFLHCTVFKYDKFGTQFVFNHALTFTRRDLNSYSQPSRTTLFSLGI